MTNRTWCGMFKLMGLAHKFCFALSVLVLLVISLLALASCSAADTESGQPTLRQSMTSIAVRTEAIEGYVSQIAASQANQVVADRDMKAEMDIIRKDIASIREQLSTIEARIK